MRTSIPSKLISPAVLLSALFLLSVLPPQAQATEAAWARLAEGGYTILIGHAQTPGSGEPRRPDMGDCENRKSLSDRGIQSARRLGMRFAARAVAIGAILSGEYCRAWETAALAFGKSRVETRPFLNPPSADADPVIIPAELIAAVSDYEGTGNQLMVTHPLVIQAISGALPRTGEVIIVEPGPGPDEPIRVVAHLLLD